MFHANMSWTPGCTRQVVSELGPICLRHYILVMEGKTKELPKLQYYIMTSTKHDNGEQLCFGEYAGFIHKLTNIIQEYSPIFIIKCTWSN